MYLIFLTVLGLCRHAGFSPDAVCRLLTAAASLVVEHGLQGTQASVVAAPGELEHRLTHCGVWAWLTLGMWLSSWTGDRTRVSCIGRRILYH